MANSTINVDIDCADLQSLIREMEAVIAKGNLSRRQIDAFAELSELIKTGRQCIIYMDASGKGHVEPSMQMLDIMGRIRRG